MKLLARLPFAGQVALDFLRARAIPGIEVVGTDTYERATARARVLADGLEVDGDVERVRALFDLDAAADAIDEHLSRDPKMRALVRRTPGVRVPGAFDGFELAVRTVLGQQVSVAAATTLCARLAAAFGAPRAHVLARASIDDVARIGLPKARAATLIEIARAVHEGEVSLEPGANAAATADATADATIAKLVTLKGIGPWTAKYIAMRAFGARDVFLEEDLVVRKALTSGSRRRGAAPTPLSASEAASRAARWAPYRSYAVLRLWKGAADARRPPPSSRSRLTS